MIPIFKKLKSIATSVAVLFLFSCTNDVKEVREITAEENFPMEVQENLKLTYSDSSEMRLLLQAPLAENYPQLEDPIRKFPEGINVKFFDRFGAEDSRLRADYAIEYVNKRLWHAKGDVVVVNKKGEQLNTEELYWDERKEQIYSDVQVKLTSDKIVTWGEGFVSDQNFENPEITKVTGQIYLDEDE